MITTLIADTRTKLTLAKRLKDAQSEVSAITVTLNELEKLKLGVRQFVAAIQTSRERLGEPVVAPIVDQAVLLADEIALSRGRFTANSSNRRENLALNNAGRKLDRLTKDLNERWQLYAQDRLAPYQELLQLIIYLPEATASASELNQLMKSIEAEMHTAPRDEKQLAQFDQHLVDLGRRLERVANLPIEVRAFLMKVAAGKATMADLSPGVTAWLNEDHRAEAFAITFTTRRS